jgi:MEDS: MEthanogen/methylotroph, DcmR Sensory domain
MNSSAAAILCDPRPSEHIVCSYADDNDLADAVTLFASAGLAKKEAVILVVTAKHSHVIRRRLEQEGFNVPELQESGRLVFADAEDVLASFLLDGRIDEHRFKTGLGSMIDTARQHRGRTRPVRVFGEMVDLIWISNPDATLRLEQLGNEVIESHSVTVLCAYAVGGSKPTSLPAPLLACHSHALSMADAEYHSQSVFKLHGSCVAIRREKDHRQVITLPAGASVTLVSGDIARSGVVQVLYMDQPVQMLAVDLRTQGVLDPSV